MDPILVECERSRTLPLFSRSVLVSRGQLTPRSASPSFSVSSLPSLTVRPRKIGPGRKRAGAQLCRLELKIQLAGRIFPSDCQPAKEERSTLTRRARGSRCRPVDLRAQTVARIRNSRLEREPQPEMNEKPKSMEAKRAGSLRFLSFLSCILSAPTSDLRLQANSPADPLDFGEILKTPKNSQNDTTRGIR